MNANNKEIQKAAGEVRRRLVEGRQHIQKARKVLINAVAKHGPHIVTDVLKSLPGSEGLVKTMIDGGSAEQVENAMLQMMEAQIGN